MGADTKIQWTDATWNPVRGCSRVSRGCERCYAEGVAARFSGPGLAYHGLARRSGKGLPLWTGEVRMVPEHLGDPLRWRRPRRIFVNSMSDLFHEKLSNEQIAAVFGVMALSPQHTFQVLTKRAERMRQWLEWAERYAAGPVPGCIWQLSRDFPEVGPTVTAIMLTWPLPNVWLGVSVEDQPAFDERWPHLQACQAAVRFLSIEPMLGPINLHAALCFHYNPGRPEQRFSNVCMPSGRLHWAIVGGESGQRARDFDVGAAQDVVEQLRRAGVATFVKQYGAHPWLAGRRVELSKPKGDDPAEWSEDMRVRDFPRAAQEEG